MKIDRKSLAFIFVILFLIQITILFNILKHDGADVHRENINESYNMYLFYQKLILNRKDSFN